jgi:hypothetical protein
VVLRCSHGLVCVGESEGDTEEGAVRSRGVFAVVSGGQLGVRRSAVRVDKYRWSICRKAP